MAQSSALEAATSPIDYKIGENVNTLRRRVGMSIKELGQRFEIGGSAMSLKLGGKRSWSAHDIHLAAQLFSVRMAQLMGEDPLPEPTAPATVTDISALLAERKRQSKD